MRESWKITTFRIWFSVLVNQCTSWLHNYDTRVLGPRASSSIQMLEAGFQGSNILLLLVTLVSSDCFSFSFSFSFGVEYETLPTNLVFLHGFAGCKGRAVRTIVCLRVYDPIKEINWKLH